jgi:hypothetical protein
VSAIAAAGAPVRSIHGRAATVLQSLGSELRAALRVGSEPRARELFDHIVAILGAAASKERVGGSVVSIVPDDRTLLPDDPVTSATRYLEGLSRWQGRSPVAWSLSGSSSPHRPKRAPVGTDVTRCWGFAPREWREPL